MSTCILAIGINLMQTKGFNLSFQAIQPKFSKLNPLQGFKRLLSLRSLIELGKSCVKISIIGYAIYSVLSSDRDLFMPLIGKEVVEIAQVFSHLTSKIVIRVAAIMLAVSLLDYYYQSWQHEKDLKMTKQEVKEEHKQTEGNPQIKGRIRAIQKSLARQRMMASVPKANVVITNPTHFAVALLYGPQMDAPKVLAKGADFLAQKIIELARKHKIPVVQNPPLARALYSQVKVEETIPVTLFKAVAKVLAFIYQQKKKAAS